MNNHDPKPINPLVFLEKGQKVPAKSPLIFLDREETSTMFSITKLTDNGKYVKGGMLYYKMFDVEIMADIDATIYVNLAEKSYIVKLNKSNESIQSQDPVTQQYVILLYSVSDDSSECVWMSVEGRENCYNLIKEQISTYLYDPDHSIVLTGSVSLDDCLTVTEFVNYLKNSNVIEEDDFDITQYTIDREEETDE